MATSKTPKQPPFPHPPLEVGVPQYPTPLVPDFYTKSGHIILVVKESVEKGTYNPQPLDGSITYTGRDANKFPSTLYLVHQRPSEDGQFVYNTYANDRTLSSQDPWNYGLDYSANNPSYPITSRTYITPRSSYSAASLGSTDPVFGGTQIISQQKMVELPDDNPLRSRYVVVQRVYESIPGPEIDGQGIGEFGYINLKKQVVAAGTSLPAPTLSTVKLEINPVDSVKSELTEADYSSISTLTGYQYDPDLNLVVTNTKQIVSPGTSLTPINGLISSRDEPVDVWKTIRIQSTIASLPANRTEYKTGAYSSPNLITDYNVSLINTSNAETIVKVQPVMRAKRSYQTVFKYVTSYQYGPPSGDPSYALFDPLAVNVYVDGLLFQINIPDALTDSFGPLTITTLPNNPTYGYISDTLEIQPTSTTATQYIAYVGTFQMIAYEVEYWKANIYRISEQWVLLK
jgi:hypothetical protein